MDVLRTVTAIPAGKKANGDPIDRVLTFELTAEPEHDFGRPGVSRLHHRKPAHPGLGRPYDVHVIVVRTDSITPVDPAWRMVTAVTVENAPQTSRFAMIGEPVACGVQHGEDIAEIRHLLRRGGEVRISTVFTRTINDAR